MNKKQVLLVPSPLYIARMERDYLRKKHSSAIPVDKWSMHQLLELDGALLSLGPHDDLNFRTNATIDGFTFTNISTRFNNPFMKKFAGLC